MPFTAVKIMISNHVLITYQFIYILTLYSSWLSGNNTDFTAAMYFQCLNYSLRDGFAAAVYHILMSSFYCSIMHLVCNTEEFIQGISYSY